MGRILANMKPLSDLLREWRELAHLSPSEAARQCGISPQLWYTLETGATMTPRASTLHKLAHGTGLPVERLAAASYYNPALVAVAAVS